MKKKLLITLLGLLFTVSSIFSQTIKVDKRLPIYHKNGNISGNANSIGSDTMNNLMTLWLEGFKKYYPLVNIQIEGKGSSTAPPALIEGTAQFGPMSRKMKNKETDLFEEKYGFKPTRIRTSLDALAVFVNKDNPINCMTLAELDAVFSSTRKRRHSAITTWADLGLKGVWASKPLSIYGRNSASGTYGYFKHHVMKKGDYKSSVKEQPGSASVVQGITKDKYGIGYSGIGYKTSGVKILKLSKKKGKPCVEGNYENVVSHKYPLSRYLYLNIVKYPNKSLEPLVKEFIKFVLSYQGQEIVVKAGYLPLPYKVVEKELQKIN